MAAEEERKEKTTAVMGLPPPSAHSMPKSVGEEEKRRKTTAMKSLVVMATSSSRAVTTDAAPKKRKKKGDDDSTPSGVVITWEPEGVAVEVGEPRSAPYRRNPPTVVDRGVGPTSGCGPWRESDNTINASPINEPTPSSTRCEILAPYLVPTTPKKKKQARSGRAETAPDPDAAPTPDNSIKEPAPDFINVDDVLPKFPPSRREVNRRKRQSREMKASFWAGSVAGVDATPSLIPPPPPVQKTKKRAWGSGQSSSTATPTPPIHRITRAAIPPLPARGSVKDRLGPLPNRPLRPAEVAGKEAAQKRNAEDPGRRERIAAAWEAKRKEHEEEEKKRKVVKAQEEEVAYVDDDDDDYDSEDYRDAPRARWRSEWTSDDDSEDAMQEQERLMKEWEERRKERRRKRAEERDNVTTKVIEIPDEEWERLKEKGKGKGVKGGSRDKFPGFKKKYIFGGPSTPDGEMLHQKLQDSVSQRERFIKDDSFHPGLFADNIKNINLRIDILREGRDPDSPVRDLDLPPGPSQQKDNDNDDKNNEGMEH